MIKIHKIAAGMILGAILISANTMTAEAAEEPVAGISLILQEFYENANEAADEAVQVMMTEMSVQNNLAFAKVTNYVNIRSEASEEGEILGKLYNNAAATILLEEDGWYKIVSGSVTGYIKADYLVTGEEAEQLSETLGTKIAVVNTTTLKVRSKANTESEVLSLIAEGDEYPVADEQDEWVKIAIEDGAYGYVSKDYVVIQMIYEEAVSIEEEQERLAEEAAADRAESSSSNDSSGSDSKASVSNSEAVSDGSSSAGSEIASYAKQFVGNPYVWGGTSLTNGADCSGFTQSVFAHFGISISRTSRTQATGGKSVSISNLQPGDLVFYERNGTINHVAIYIGSGKVISASSPETGIRITSLYYRQPCKAVRYTN